LTWGPKGLPVPFAVAWSGEATSVAGLCVRRGRLAYEDEVAQDRDRHGILWARVPDRPGAGRPDYRAMHTVRQRAAVLGLRCQVCGGPADRTSRGWLFLLPAHEQDAPASEPNSRTPHGDSEGLLTTKPPICLPCADLAVRHCPHLRRPALVRSRKPRVWGVFGGFCTPGADGSLIASEDAYLPYGSPGAPWFLASQAVLELTRCS
jgi:hypothetical protein